MITQIDTDILHATDIHPNVCFVYDDVAFPYIVIWYSTKEHKNHYQLFYNRSMCVQFADILRNRGKSVACFMWNTFDQAYISFSGM